MFSAFSNTNAGPGIASATGTAVDSAAKHTMACRVDEDRMFMLAKSEQDIRRNKSKYNVNRHELVLNCGQPWIKSSREKRSSAYPLIISNLGDITDESKTVIANVYKMLFDPTCLPMVRAYINSHEEANKSLQEFIRILPYFRFQGYSLGVASAHHEVGDIICAVQVGGMLTVQNGAFECETGQMVQWYFDFEEPLFHGDSTFNTQAGANEEIGARKQTPFITNIALLRARQETEAELRRKNMSMRQYGSHPDREQNKRNIFLLKPYVPNPGGIEHYGDKIRICGKCVSGGRPWDRIDIMMMTQSL